ncbi:hypothetical protein, partial [Moellerella wisconsensis]|uniref:hypothetical protein n=1 Tax=Moellerella wisconsensis TaxID=158849 RepID=UPI0030763C07
RPQTNGDIMGTLLPFVYSRVLRGIPDTPKPLRVFFLTRCACPTIHRQIKILSARSPFYEWHRGSDCFEG